MPETGSQILNYTGNANLGLGMDTNIPVTEAKPELDAVQRASDQLRMYDHQNNLTIYNQKVQDRDNLLKMLMQGQVAAGDILPENRKDYDAAEANAKEKYLAVKGLNDKEGMQAYLKAQKDWQDVANLAQHKKIAIAALQDEKSKQTLPEDIAAYDKHIKTQMEKPLGQLVDPYQKAFSFDLDGQRKAILGSGMITKGMITPDNKTVTVTDKDGKVTTKTVIAPAGKQTAKAVGGSVVDANGKLTEFSETPEKYYDYGALLKNADAAYLSGGKNAENQRQWFNKFHESNPTLQKELLDTYNARIREYSKQRGLVPDANGKFPDEIKAHQIGGKWVLDETIPSFAAKDALANVEGDYVQKPQQYFDKDKAGYLLDKEKADADKLYKASMAAAANKKANAYVSNMSSQIRAREGDPQKNQYLDEIYNKNLTQQTQLISPSGQPGKVVFADINAKNSLPVFTWSKDGKPILLKPFGSTPILEGNKIVGYSGGSFQQQYLFKDKAIPPQQIAKMYTDFKAEHPEWDKSFDDYIKLAIENNVFDVKLNGENGATNRVMSREAQRAISNTLTKKGQDAVFEADVAEPVEE